MSMYEITPDQLEPAPQPSGDMFDDPEFRAAVQRGIDRANQDLQYPELQKLPDPKIIEVTPTTRAVLGSRATKGALSTFGDRSTQSAVSGNPEGRSPAALRRQNEIIEAELRDVVRKVDQKRGR